MPAETTRARRPAAGANLSSQALNAIARAAEHANAQADAFAHLQHLFPGSVWRHEASGAIRIVPKAESVIEWSPREERRLGGFSATFGAFRFGGRPFRLSAEQLDALTAYAAAVEAPPPAVSAAQVA